MSRVEILHLDDANTWKSYIDRLPSKCITHYPRFLRVQEETGNGTAECFVYQESGHLVLFPYLRRPLARLPFGGDSFKGHCDIITAYCYGGPIHNLETANESPPLLTNFRQAFHDYALDSGVVTEFVRFHPHLQNYVGFEGLFDKLHQHQRNVVIDLDGGEEALLSRCRPTFRRYIRKAKSHGLTLRREPPGQFLESFAELYKATMTRHGQTGYLNFPQGFFRALFATLRDDMVVFSVRQEDKVAAAAVFLLFGEYVEYFLGASDEALLSHHPNHFMFYEASCWAHEKGFKHLHLGGGTKPLIFFKRGFSKRSCSFYIGQTTHNREVCAELTTLRDAWEGTERHWDPGFFPPYRRGMG